LLKYVSVVREGGTDRICPLGWPGNTPLHLAVVDQQDDNVALLVKAGANPEAPNEQGITPLQLCSDQLKEIIHKATPS
jgi:ankyrin repeat protein